MNLFAVLALGIVAGFVTYLILEALDLFEGMRRLARKQRDVEQALDELSAELRADRQLRRWGH